MSLIGRFTDDYSPLRSPTRDNHGRDIRPQAERRNYEQAINARREMMSTFETREKPVLTKREYDRLRRIPSPRNFDPEITEAQREKFAYNATGRSRRIFKDMMAKGPRKVAVEA